MGEQLGFYLDLDRCIQCHACEVACKAFNNIEPGITWRKVISLWAGSYPDLIHRTITFTCLHCAEPTCKDVCPTKAIIKRSEDGIVLVDSNLCNGCGDCADACPYGIPQFDQNGILQMCDLCFGRLDQDQQPVCVTTCPGEALHFGPLEELAKKNSTHILAGPNKPSMLVSSQHWSKLEGKLPWV